MLLDRNRVQLGVIDIQERLVPAIHESARVVDVAQRLIRAARRLSIPVWASEQYPKGLGPSVPELASHLRPDEILVKTAFSCAKEPALSAYIEDLRRRQIVLCGMESHVCILQTAIDLKHHGYDVAVVLDGVSSRLPENVQAAVARMRHAGIWIVTLEMVLFEWIGDSGDPAFSDIRNLIV